ncbi:MAG: DUF169 domain-containing protein [Methanosarcinaceae archaeon]|nr:DUF169 domain-containing protein [Methanosarcinaceae archaeon]
MDSGEPVCITFEDSSSGERSDLLYCELVQKARYGESFCVSVQQCPVGAYVLGISDNPPQEYYFRSGRYSNMEAASRASGSLPRVDRKYNSIRVEPLSKNKGKFDVLILYLKPESAMRIVQAHSYSDGTRVLIDTVGAASVCGDCTALPLEKGLGLSFGCKGSRKHSGYQDVEVPIGIAFELVEKIEEGLEKIPTTIG